MDTRNNTQPNILLTLFMKEKATEASVRRALTEASKARDVAFSDMKKSQAAHVLAVSKHETLQTELRQRTMAVMLIHDAWKKSTLENPPDLKKGDDNIETSANGVEPCDNGATNPDDSKKSANNVETNANGVEPGVSGTITTLGGSAATLGNVEKTGDCKPNNLGGSIDVNGTTDANVTKKGEEEASDKLMVDKDEEALDKLMVDSLEETERILLEKKQSVEKECSKTVDTIENCNIGENLNNSGTSKAVPVSPERKTRHAGNELPNSNKRSRKK